MLVKQGLC